MSSVKVEQQKVAEKLQDALDRLQTDVKRVEIWAGALTGFAQPVPEYGAANCDKFQMGQGEGDTNSDVPTTPEPSEPR